MTLAEFVVSTAGGLVLAGLFVGLPYSAVVFGLLEFRSAVVLSLALLAFHTGSLSVVAPRR